MKLIMVFFSLNQHFDIIICVYWFELFSQVSDVAHWPLVYVSKHSTFHETPVLKCLKTFLLEFVHILHGFTRNVLLISFLSFFFDNDEKVKWLWCWRIVHCHFFCQLCVHLSGGTAVNTGSEGTTCMRKGRSLGHQTTIPLDL